MARRVLVIGTQAGEPPPGLPESRTGLEYVITSDPTVLRSALPGTEIVFHYGTPKDALRDAWDVAHDVRWMHVGGVGVNAQLFDALISSDVTVTNSRGVFDVTLPEYLLTLMLALAKDLPGTLAAQADHAWRHRLLEPLSGGRVVILGAGSIARGAAGMLRSMGMDVSVVGQRARERDGYQVRTIDELQQLLPDADWLVGLLPLTPATRGLIGAAELALLPPRARVVNIGRGPTFVEQDLIHALESGSVAGAALDVYEVEPLPADSPLWAMPNVILSPHIGGDVVDTGATLTAVFLANLERYLAGQPLEDVVDKQAGFVPSEA